MTYIMSCVWPDYMVKYFQSKNCEGSSPTDKKCTASFLVPVYKIDKLLLKLVDFTYSLLTFHSSLLKLVDQVIGKSKQ